MESLAQLLVEDAATFKDTETIVGVFVVVAIVVVALWAAHRK